MEIIEFWDSFLNVMFIPLYIFTVFTVHEYGHYAAARFFNIGIDSFSLGYGRKLWDKTDKRGTLWSVRLFPLCGHVQLSAGNKPVKGKIFNEAPLWQRIVIVAAGPAINIIFAFLILFLFIGFFGQPSKVPVITGVEPGEAADRAGLHINDRFLAIEGTKVLRYKDVWDYTAHRPGEELTVTIQRGDEILQKTVTPSLIEYTNMEGLEKSHGRIGVMIGQNFLKLKAIQALDGIELEEDTDDIRAALLANTGREIILKLKSADGKGRDYRTFIDPEMNAHLNNPDHKFYDAFYAGGVKDNFYLMHDATTSLMEAGRQTGQLIKNVVQLPFQLFPIDKELIRPWALVQDEDRFAERKLYEFVYRVALLSVFIALLNLVPFPGLDGNLLLMFILEGTVGYANPTGKRAYKYILLVSLCMLYGFIMMANLSDFPDYVERKMEKLSGPD